MEVAGTVVIAPRALTQVVRGIVHDLLGSPVGATSVDLQAAHAGLAVSVGAPAPLSAPDGYLVRLHETRQQIAGRVEELTGRHVASVDLRVTGVLPTTTRRVR